jgi:hypothetical protein
MVLPSISPLSDNEAGAGVVDVPPPLKFRPLRGPITDVRIGAEQVMLKPSIEMSLAKIAGLKYERNFLDYLREKCPWAYIHPHIHFRDDGVYRTVIPDAVLCSGSGQGLKILVIEVKSQHMPEAWWQLERLYIPVFEAMEPLARVCGLEVVKVYDPQMPWPGQYVYYNDFNDALECDVRLGVFKWKKT